MYNDIIKFLNIEDENLIIKKIITVKKYHEIHIEKRIGTEFCPSCHSRMHSKGFYTRTINHPILQDGFQLKLILKQRNGDAPIHSAISISMTSSTSWRNTSSLPASLPI